MSDNGDVTPTETRESGTERSPAFPPKPKGGYCIKVEYATDRVIAWAAIKAFHGPKNGNVKERDREVAIGTRNGIVYKCDVDRVSGKIGFAPGWMVFQSGEQIDHLLKCFAWQLTDDGPGIELEDMVIADEVISALKVIAAKAEADRPPVEKPKPKAKPKSRLDRAPRS